MVSGIYDGPSGDGSDRGPGMMRIIALCRRLGDWGRINTEAGRWCRLGKLQVEVIAGCMLFVAISFLYVIWRLLVAIGRLLGLL
jgi:hypothetical protein